MVTVQFVVAMHWRWLPWLQDSRSAWQPAILPGDRWALGSLVLALRFPCPPRESRSRPVGALFADRSAVLVLKLFVVLGARLYLALDNDCICPPLADDRGALASRTIGVASRY
jgi:hypothetical protein